MRRKGRKRKRKEEVEVGREEVGLIRMTVLPSCWVPPLRLLGALCQDKSKLVDVCLSCPPPPHLELIASLSSHAIQDSS